MLQKSVPLGIYEKALPPGEDWLTRLQLAGSWDSISLKCRSMKATAVWRGWIGTASSDWR